MQPIARISSIDHAVNHIRDSILSGAYRKGDKLPAEMELCELLHVGRSTVREALRVLQAMGLVEIRHGKGAFVTDRENAVTPEMWFQKYNYKVADIMQVRLPIEQMAVRLAAINMQEKELSHLQEIQDSFRRAVEENNVNQMTLADEYFHGAIIEGTHNPLLISFNANLTEAMREYRLHSFSVPGNPEHAVGPHEDILSALRLHNPELAAAYMVTHIQSSLSDMQRIL